MLEVLPRPRVVCLMGPTAAGKTACALACADQFNMEIISVDSAMIYRGMTIGTAKPEVALLQRYPHHLIDIRDPLEVYSAAEFKKDCELKIKEIFAKGKQPLLVGGTMLYFKALQQGLSLLPAADATLRAQLSKQLHEKGSVALHDELKLIDPIAAARIHPNDPQRVQRALEVYKLTGQCLSEYFHAPMISSPYDFLNIAIAPSDRSVLHRRIAERFLQMLNQGLIAEVETLKKIPGLSLALPSLRAVGYRQVWHYLEGQFDRAVLCEKAIAATRQLAKRQLTWLRAMNDVMWCESATEVIHYLQQKPASSL